MNNPSPKLNVVCHVEIQPDVVSRFVWSDGADSFEMYELDPFKTGRFLRKARECRTTLQSLVVAHANNQVDKVRALSIQLASQGHALFGAMFDPDKVGARAIANEARDWLLQCTKNEDVESLEILFKGRPLVPWNAMYIEPPTHGHPVTSPDFWKPFWGVRYNIGAGRSTSPLRRLRLIDNPTVAIVRDPKVYGSLKALSASLDAFVSAHNIPVATSLEQLEAICESQPDVIYWFGHATPRELHLGDSRITPDLLFELLSPGRKAGRGLAFLNACQTAFDEPGEGSFIDALFDAGLNGLIATEEVMASTFGHAFGAEFLKSFLAGGTVAGELLRTMRANRDTDTLPLTLLYGAYCPPRIRVGQTRFASNGAHADASSSPTTTLKPNAPAISDGGSAASTAAQVPVHIAAAAVSVIAMQPSSSSLPASPPILLGAEPAVVSADDVGSELPDKPYPSLGPYDRASRALFTGREIDIERFAEIVDDPRTRLIALHGDSGVGKSSFLRAGVIPYLEDEIRAYRFVRDRSGGAADNETPVLFVRATADPCVSVAAALCSFCAAPIQHRTPSGKIVEVDLPGRLEKQLGRSATTTVLTNYLRVDPDRLGPLLAALTEGLPYSLVLVIDQAEEIFTLEDLQEKRRKPEDVEAISDDAPIATGAGRTHALAMLAHVSRTNANVKVIVSLRTEYFGRLIGGLRAALHGRVRVDEYFLADLDRDQLANAIRRPTEFAKYGFDLTQDVSDYIAGMVLEATRGRRDSALPLLQVVCAQLYEKVKADPNRGDRPTITRQDFDGIGGVSGGMQRHVEAIVTELASKLDGEPELTAQAVMRLCARLSLVQPDGTLTTSLVPRDHLANAWDAKGTGVQFDRVLQNAVVLKLLRLTSLPAKDEGEDRKFVSLGHDAIAGVAVEWERRANERAKALKIAARATRSEKTWKTITSFSMVASMIGAGASAWHFLLTQDGKVAAEGKAEKADEEKRKSELLKDLRTAATNAWFIAQQAGHELEASDAAIDVASKPGAGDDPETEATLLRVFFAARSGLASSTVLKQHDADVTHVAIDAKGVVAATSDRNGVVDIWNVESAQTRWSHSYAQPVAALSLAPDGSRILIAAGHFVDLCGTADGSPCTRFEHPTQLRGARFAGTTGGIITAADDGVRIFRSWKSGQTVPSHYPDILPNIPSFDPSTSDDARLASHISRLGYAWLWTTSPVNRIVLAPNPPPKFVMRMVRPRSAEMSLVTVGSDDRVYWVDGTKHVNWMDPPPLGDTQPDMGHVVGIDDCPNPQNPNVLDVCVIGARGKSTATLKAPSSAAQIAAAAKNLTPEPVDAGLPVDAGPPAATDDSATATMDYWRFDTVTRKWMRQRAMEGHTGEIREAAIARGSGATITGSADKTSRVWRRRMDDALKSAVVFSNASRDLGVAASLRAPSVVTPLASSSGFVAISHGAAVLLNPKLEETARAPLDGMVSAHASGSGTVAFVDQNGKAWLVPAVDKNAAKRELATSGDATVVDIARDAGVIVVGHKSGDLAFFRSSGEALGRSAALHGQKIVRVRIGDSGDRAIALADDGSIAMIDVATGKALLGVEKMRDSLFGLAFFGEQRDRIVAGRDDGRYSLIGGGTAARAPVVVGHRGRINDIDCAYRAYRSLKRVCATAGEDGAIGLWSADGDEWRLLAMLRGHGFGDADGAVRSVRFDATGERVVSIGDDGTVKVWDVDIASVGKQVCDTLAQRHMRKRECAGL